MQLLPSFADGLSLLVSLDKRTIVWQDLNTKGQGTGNNPSQSSVSVGDVVIKMQLMKATALSMHVIALSQKGHIYKLQLNPQRGLTVEQLYAQTSQRNITVTSSSIVCGVDTDFFTVLYGTDEGQVGMIKRDTSGIQQKIIRQTDRNVKISSVLLLRNG